MEDNGTIYSRTHFKPSAGNSYLHARSHHHPRWIKNVPFVPFGQFCRLKRTCTLKKDYEDKSFILKNKFKEKGYEEAHIEDAF